MKEEIAQKRRGVWILLALVLLVAAVLRRAGWNNWSLWLDEAMEVDYARRGLEGMLGALVFDGNHPPLDYLIIYHVRRVSEADAILRLPSLLWGVGATAALFFAAGGSKRPFQALSAATAFACLPIAVHYGQEVRPYSLALLFVAAAEAFRRAFVERRKGWLLFGYVLAGIGAAYTLYLALWALVFIWILEFLEAWQGRRDDPARLRVAGAVPVIVLLCFAPWLIALRGRQKRPHEMSAPKVTPHLLTKYAVGLAADRQESDRDVPAAVVWMVTLVGLSLTESRERRWIVVTFLGYTAAVLVLLLLTDHWWDLRYIILGSIPLSRAVGEGVGGLASRFPGRLSVPACAACLAGLLLVEASALGENIRTSRVDWRRAAEYLDYQRRAGRDGAVLAADGWTYFVLRFQTLRLNPPLETGPIVDSLPALRSALEGRRSGWIVRTPHHPGPTDLDEFLSSGPPPWSVFSEAETARLYRFENGRIVR